MFWMCCMFCMFCMFCILCIFRLHLLQIIFAGLLPRFGWLTYAANLHWGACFDVIPSSCFNLAFAVLQFLTLKSNSLLRILEDHNFVSDASNLTEIEKTLTQWKDFLPDPRDKGHFKTPNKQLGPQNNACEDVKLLEKPAEYHRVCAKELQVHRGQSGGHLRMCLNNSTESPHGHKTPAKPSARTFWQVYMTRSVKHLF